MLTEDFDYYLPPRLIAQQPVEPRDSSRLLVLHRSDGRMEHRRFSDLPGFLDPGDLLVVNDSRVIPARLLSRKEEGGGRVELLLLHRLPEGGEGAWEALVRPSKRLPVGARVLLDGDGGERPRAVVTILERLPPGTRAVRLEPEEAALALGRVPLPPYIHTPLADPERYQTVYGRVAGSVAAPTAGLHFTEGLLGDLKARGVRLSTLTLHVGPGTFQPVRAEDPRQHHLAQEAFTLPNETVRAVQETKASGRRVVAVGTTCVRVLEEAAIQCRVGEGGKGVEVLRPLSGWTGLFILPGFRFRLVDAMVTNFHLPRSTLLMLVSAFAGRETVLRAYAEAVAQEYRFYSFGDAMLVV